MEKNKQIMTVALVLLAIIGIIMWLRRRSSQESGYVMPRGYFLPITTTPTTPTTTPTTTTTDTTSGARTMGDGTTSGTTTPTPPPTAPAPTPITAYPVAGGTYFYDPITKTYILNPMAQVTPQQAMQKVEVAKAEVAKIESAKTTNDIVSKLAIISPLLLIVIIFLLIRKNY
jgi:hypothetical protein